jgi:signal transduction histidine kinase/CheY-like chemotaxis protein
MYMSTGITGSSFQRSIRRITLVACLAGVGLAGLSLGAVHFVLMYRSQIKEKRALVQVIAANSAGSLAFDDRRAAREILASLAAQSAIRSAVLTRAESPRIFAIFIPVDASANAASWSLANFSVIEPVRIGTQAPLGYLEIEADLTPVLVHIILIYAALLPLVLVLSGGVSWWAGRRLQKRFIGPLYSLMDTAGAVSNSGDYALRAPPGQGDELGRLIETFNIMLGRIEVQSAQVHASEAELNRKVVDLEAEIALRQQAEQSRRQSDEQRVVLERKMQEAQRLEGLGIMAGGIAHDFNNLLTAMLGHSSLARLKASGDAALVIHLTAIEVAARRATELCRQMLIYTGRRKPEYTRIEVASLLAEMVSLLEVSVGKSCTLEMLQSEGRHVVAGDAAQIRQVLLNLVVNAADAIGTGRGTITTSVCAVQLDEQRLTHLRFSADAQCGAYVEITVRDSGCGMTPEVLGRIFDPFFSTKFTGRGLGLAAVASIMRHHHGALHVESEVGKGTVFHVYLPAATGDEVIVPQLPPDGCAGPSGDVLLVDDEDAPRTAVEAMLVHGGYEVKACAGGLEALGVFGPEGLGFGAAVLDFAMPGMSGGTLSEAIRIIRPDLPVLLISGHINEVELNIPPKVHFLRKPFTAEELARALDEACRLIRS